MPASSALDTTVWRPPSPWRRVLILLLGVLAVLAILLAALYFVSTRKAFLKRVVLPRLSEAWHAQITASDVSLSPLSGFELHQLKIETEGQPPLFEAQRVFVRYRLHALLAGRLEFPEIVMDTPQANWVRHPDGRTNLDPLREARAIREETKPARRAPRPFHIGALTVTNGTLRLSRLAADGGSQVSEINALALGLENVGNDQQGRVRISAGLSHTATAGTGLTNGQGRLQGALTGDFTARLDRRLRPSLARGEARLRVAKADGTLADLQEVVGTLGCDLADNEVRNFSVRFERAGKGLGVIGVRGSMDLNRSEARLSLEITSVDRTVLNLAGAPFGLDFRDTQVNAKTTVDLSRGGELLAITGRGAIAKFSLRQGAAVTPPVDLDLDCHFTTMREEQSAVLHRFALRGQQARGEFFSAVLDSPMYLAWGRLPQGVNQSIGRIAVRDLRLGDWTALLGTNTPSGTLNLTSTVTCQLDGRRLAANIAGGLDDVQWTIAGHRFDRGALTFQGSGAFSDYRSLLLENYTVQLSEEGVPLATASGSAGYDLSTRDSNLQLVLESDLPKVLSQFPIPRLSATAGRVSVDGLLGRERQQHNIALNFNLRNLSGVYDRYRFDNHDARMEINAEITDQSVNLRRLQIASRQGVGTFGVLDLAGKRDLASHKGEYTLNINGLSETTFRPFLAPFLSPVELASVRLSGNGSLQHDPLSGIAVKFETDLQGFRMRDPAGIIPGIPVDLQLLFDAEYRSNVVDLTRLVVALPSTPRATNQIVAQARLDLARTNARTGHIRVTAAALDLSDLLQKWITNRTAAVVAARSVPASPTPTADTAPKAFHWPIQECVADLKIDRLYANNAVISDWIATARLTNNTVVLDPFRLAAQGAPLRATAKLDLSSPEFACDLNVQADQVPLGPFVEAFAPDRRGQITGGLDAAVQLTATRTPEASLPQTLAGTFQAGSTNLDLALANVRSPLLKSLLDVVLAIPELRRDPTGALGNPIGQLTGSAPEQQSAWVTECAKSPIRSIAARGKAARGRIELEHARVESAAFRADARGAIQLAPVA